MAEYRSKKKLIRRVRREATLLLRRKPDADIDDLIRVCLDKGLIVQNSIDGSEDLVFDAIAGTEYSTLYDACGHGRTQGHA